MDGIEVFVEVVDAQSFTRAAQQLEMPTTTVSAQIARLEQRLGVTLIRRTTRKLHVTDAGHRYYEHCVRVLAELNEAERELAATIVEPTGPWRITATADVAQGLMVPLVEKFLKQYPKASVEFIITRRVVDLIAERVDLAVRVGPFSDSTLTVRKFVSIKLALWAAPAYLKRAGTPTSPAGLSGHELISSSTMPRRAKLKSAEGTTEIDFDGRLSADDFGTLRTFVLRGSGIGMLPEFVGTGLAAEGRLVRLLPGHATEAVTFHFAYPAQKFVPLTVRAFIGLVAGERAGLL